MNYSKIEDNELCTMYKEGDQRAFSELYNRYEGLVKMRLQKYVTYDKQEIDDIAQEIWSTAAKYIKQSFRGDSKFTTYLYRIVFTRYLNHFRYTKPNFSTAEEQKSYEHFIYGIYGSSAESYRHYGCNLEKSEYYNALNRVVEVDDLSKMTELSEEYFEIVRGVLEKCTEDEQKFFVYRGDSNKGLLQASRETGVSYWKVKERSLEIANEIEELWNEYIRNYH